MPLTLLQTGESQLTLEWSIDAPIARNWSVLTDPSYLSQWLGTLVHGAVSSEASFVVDHGDGYSCQSTVIEWETERALGYTWKFPDEPVTDVSWKLSPIDHGTKLTLTHSGLSNLRASYRDGWLVHLTYLEACALGTPLPTAMFWNLHSAFSYLNARTETSFS